MPKIHKNFEILEMPISNTTKDSMKLTVRTFPSTAVLYQCMYLCEMKRLKATLNAFSMLFSSIHSDSTNGSKFHYIQQDLFLLFLRSEGSTAGQPKDNG
jgi:hypothetical protein